MKKFKRGLLFLAVFLAVMTVLYLLLVLSARIPNASIAEHMRSTAQQYFGAERYAFSEDGLLRNVTDNYADLISMNISWHLGRGNPFVSVLKSAYYDGKQFGTAMGLLQSISADTPANVDYSRYWHGMALLIRPLHLFTDVQGVKTILMVILSVLAGITLGLLLKRKHPDLCASLLLSLAMVQFWNLRLSVEYLGCFLVCFALCPAFLLLEKRGDSYLGALCVISGAMTAFFDFLTTETVTLLLPLILVVAIRAKERRLGAGKDTALLLLQCFLCWGAAYAGAFLVKWIAASVATGENHFLTALRSAGKRVSSSVPGEATGGLSRFTMGVAANLSVLFGATRRIDYSHIGAGLLWSALVLFYAVSHFPRRPYLRRGTGALLFLGGMVLLRYFVLANHSYTHAFFTYRALVSTVLAVLTAVQLNLPQLKRKERP